MREEGVEEVIFPPYGWERHKQFTHASICCLDLCFDLLTTGLLFKKKKKQKTRCNLRYDTTKAGILDESTSRGIGK